MKASKKSMMGFTVFEIILWSASAVAIICACYVFGFNSSLTPIASLVGVTSLILNAKGNPLGQVLMILFSMLYGYISFEFAYYGEMITYIGMTAPMALAALISWLRHPYKGRRSRVMVGRIVRSDAIIMPVCAIAVTAAFYFILEYFDTANLYPSTISVTTSFIAAYLTFRRSPYFALAYASNDVVLVILWSLAAAQNVRYLSVVVCFAAFFVGDLYGFVSWQKMKKKQGLQ